MTIYNKEIVFRTIKADDWPLVAEIYKQGIDTGNATFQQEIPTWDEWDKGHLSICRIIAVFEKEIIGWAALSAVSGRSVYAGVAEVSVYVSANHRGQKNGTRILAKLIQESELNGIWTLQASVFPENILSIKIQENLGFRKVGYREKIGKVNNLWRDTLILERRSKVVGAN